MDSANVGQDVLATLRSETNQDVPNGNAPIDIDSVLLDDEQFSKLLEYFDCSPLAGEETHFPHELQNPPDMRYSTSEAPEIQPPSSPSQPFTPNNLNFLTYLADYPEPQFPLNSTFNTDSMSLFDIQLFNSVPIVDSSNASVPSDRSIESRNTSLQLSSPGASSFSETEGVPRQKAKSITTRRSNTGVRQCDLNRVERRLKKPLRCSECNHGSAWRRDLDRHIISRHREKAQAMGLPLEEFACKYPSCEAKLTRKDRLVRHLRKIHGEHSPKRTK